MDPPQSFIFLLFQKKGRVDELETVEFIRALFDFVAESAEDFFDILFLKAGEDAQLETFRSAVYSAVSHLLVDAAEYNSVQLEREGLRLEISVVLGIFALGRRFKINRVSIHCLSEF